MELSTLPWTRRRFLKAASIVSSSAVSCFESKIGLAQSRPETTKIRFVGGGTPICLAPQYLAGALLKTEGFTDIAYTSLDEPPMRTVASGAADFCMEFAGVVASHLDSGDPVIALAGVHIGCLELIVTKDIGAVRDIKGKRISVFALGSSEHIFLATMAAQIGLDPRKDVEWVTAPAADSVRLLTAGKIDGFLAWAPEPQELRAKKIGHSVVNTATDKPWSQYYCCMLVGNRQFIENNPIATKRALRAVLKSADVCALEPERAARYVVEKGYTRHYEYAVQALRELPYDAWRTYDPADTLRFYALRMHEVGMIKSTPQNIIAQGTDWRFLQELKRELKA